MTVQHTPGPWRWELNLASRGLQLCGGTEPYDITVLQPCRWGMFEASVMFRNPMIDGNVMLAPHEVADWRAPYPGREHHSHWLQNITHPDAFLIAAAPKLLEALRKAHDVLSANGMVSTDDIERAVVIRKALGLSPKDPYP